MNAPIDHNNDRDRDRARTDASRPRWANEDEWKAAEAVPFIPTLPAEDPREAEHLDRLAAELAASAAAQFAASVTQRAAEPAKPERVHQPEPRPERPEARLLPRFESHGDSRPVIRQETRAEFRTVLRQEARAEFHADAQDSIPMWMQKPHALQPAQAAAAQALPPIEQPARFRFGYAARAFVLAMTAAGGAYVLVYGLPEPLRQMFSERMASTGEPAPSKAGRIAGAKLVASDIRGIVGDWIPLNITIDGQMRDGDAIITGFAPGMTLSMGEPYGSGGWRVAAADLPKLQAHLPANFNGGMDLAVELRRGDTAVIDRKAIRFDAANPRLALASMGRTQPPAPPQGIGPVSTPAPSAGRGEETVIAALPRNQTNQAVDEVNIRARQMDPAEATVMLKRGEELAKTGDLAAARLLLQRVAEANHPGAAFALAATYDPIVLKQLSVLGMSGDVAIARQWYERARDLGQKEAAARLEALARWGR